MNNIGIVYQDSCYHIDINREFYTPDTGLKNKLTALLKNDKFLKNAEKEVIESKKNRLNIIKSKEEALQEMEAQTKEIKNKISRSRWTDKNKYPLGNINWVTDKITKEEFTEATSKGYIELIK